MADALTLYELNNLVKGVLENSLDEEYWVTGEFSEARAGYGGHLYAELVQKDESGRSIVAKARVNCWARQYNMLRLRFLHETGEEIRAGLKVMALVRVTFHEQYGYALQLIDLDPSYTLGDMARRRQEILLQLEKEGILHDNQQLPLPRLLQRIAVISSANAAGYGDFCHQIEDNEYGLHFYLQLFPAVMQGANVEQSVLEALFRIADEEEDWDAVVIIRGGGATSDLSDFDSYSLASAIAQFPLPVIVGIGHDRDQTVLDLVAHTSLKTPTAVAAFLVEHQSEELAELTDLRQRIMQSAQQRLLMEHNRLDRHAAFFPLAFSRMKERQLGRLALMEQRLQMSIMGRVERERNHLDVVAQRFSAAVPSRLERENHRLDMLSQRFELLNPDRLLERGYSITLCGGRIVKDINDVSDGDVITTRLQSGELYSKVLAKQAPLSPEGE